MLSFECRDFHITVRESDQLRYELIKVSIMGVASRNARLLVGFCSTPSFNGGREGVKKRRGGSPIDARSSDTHPECRNHT